MKETYCTVYTKESPEGIELTCDEWMEFDDNLLHRENNPAVVFANGTQHWWINDEHYTEEEFNNHPLVIEYKIKQEITEALEGELI